MHEVGAIIGGEGNGGVIYPASHYGRDAMVGVALFLSQLAHKKMSASAYKATLPQYYIAKNKMALSDKSLIDKILEKVKEHYASERVNTIDGVKVDFEQKRRTHHPHLFRGSYRGRGAGTRRRGHRDSAIIAVAAYGRRLRSAADEAAPRLRLTGRRSRTGRLEYVFFQNHTDRGPAGPRSH